MQAVGNGRTRNVCRADAPSIGVEVDAAGAKRRRIDRPNERCTGARAKRFPKRDFEAPPPPPSPPLLPPRHRYGTRSIPPGLRQTIRALRFTDTRGVKSLKYCDNATRTYVPQFGSFLSGFESRTTTRKRALLLFRYGEISVLCAISTARQLYDPFSWLKN